MFIGVYYFCETKGKWQLHNFHAHTVNYTLRIVSYWTQMWTQIWCSLLSLQIKNVPSHCRCAGAAINQWNIKPKSMRIPWISRKKNATSPFTSHCRPATVMCSPIGGNIHTDVTSVTRFAPGYKYKERPHCHFTTGKKRRGVLASTVFERNFFLRPSFRSARLHSTRSLPYLNTTEKNKIAVKLFLYRFVKKKHQKRQPKWSPKCVRTTTATARLQSTGWSTWSCLPPTPTLLWWETTFRILFLIAYTWMHAYFIFVLCVVVIVHPLPTLSDIIHVKTNIMK